MPHRPSSPIACLWLPLAAWLALWPAVQSQQMAARERGPERTAVAGGGCCRARPGDVLPGPDGGQGHGCCAGREESPVRPPACPEGGSSRCTQCLGAGGPLLLAHALAVPEPGRARLGAIRHGDHVAASRDLRPPVPPPRALDAFLLT